MSIDLKTGHRRPRMIKLIVVMLVLFALFGPALRYLGLPARAQISEVRRTGGAESHLLHRYWFSIGYEFTAADGRRYSGHSRSLAADTGPQSFRPIEPVFYLAAFPSANVLARDAGPHAGTAAVLGVAALLVWLSAPPAKRERQGAARQSGKLRAKPTPPAPLSPQQTERWIRTYRRHARWYVWGFFLLVILCVLLLLWLEMGVIDQDVMLSLGFFVVVFSLLARWSRRATQATWRGVVSDKRIKVESARSGGLVDARRVIVVESDSGQHEIHAAAALYDYFHIGDGVFKLAGFDWPEKLQLDATSRACVACGELFDNDATQCPRCAAPVPDHATLVRGLLADPVRAEAD